MSYRAGEQVLRLDYAIKTNDPALLREEAGRAKGLIAELSSIQAKAQDQHVACKEKLAGCTKYKWGFIALAGFLALLAVYKVTEVCNMKSKIKNLKQADHVLYEIAGLQSELEKIDNDADKQIGRDKRKSSHSRRRLAQSSSTIRAGFILLFGIPQGRAFQRKAVCRSDFWQAQFS